MTNKINLEAWLENDTSKQLNEVDFPPASAQPDPMGMQAPPDDPMMGQMAPGAAPIGQNDPNISNMTQQIPGDEDISNDPEFPDMPEERNTSGDFEVWKNEYFKESIKGDTHQLMDLLAQVKDAPGLMPHQKKFVRDNWNVQLIRQNSNVLEASKEIRKLLKQQLDQNNPATSVINHLSQVMEGDIMLNNIFIKMDGYGSLKMDLHRKYLAALLGAVQVGTGANTEDIVFNEREYSILISTRMNSRWGDVFIGDWTLREDDPQRHLSEPELQKLESGSPEEKEVLRRRVVLESIAKQFETRAFTITVIGEDGTLYHFGWDIAGSLRAAYSEGKLVVRTRQSDNSEAMIDDTGAIVPLIDLDIYYVRETGEQTPDGRPETEEIPFIEKRYGKLYLVAALDTIREATQTLQGAVFKEIPYMGNPTDLETLRNCVYSAHDLIMRQC